MKTPGLFQNNLFNYKSVVQYGSKSRNWLLNLFPSKICLVRHVPKAPLSLVGHAVQTLKYFPMPLYSSPPLHSSTNIYFLSMKYLTSILLFEKGDGEIFPKEAQHKKGCVSALKRCQLRKMRLHKNKDSSFLCFGPISTNIFAIVSVFSRDFLFASVKIWRKWCNYMFSLSKLNMR